ncbi:MAG: metallophosphoesterase, partial [Bacteroidales bacterium]
FTWGDMAFFSLNSTAVFMGEQEQWLEEEIINTGKPWNIVYFHHSPYSTGKHGNERKMQFDYHGMGIDVVFTGHDHNYSRIEKIDEPNLYYIISGNGGKSLYACGDKELDPALFTVNCFDEDYGAVRGIYDGTTLILEFFAVSNTLNPVDRIVIEK